MLNEINNSINIMSTTSFYGEWIRHTHSHTRCKAEDGFYVSGALYVHVIIHGIEYSGDEFLNVPHIFAHRPLCTESERNTNTFHFTIPQLEIPIQHLWNEQTIGEWTKRKWQPHTHTYTLWILHAIHHEVKSILSNWVIVKLASDGNAFAGT